MPAADVRELIGQEVWHSYFKFCVVRNPFEKCISAFCHLGNGYQVQGYAVYKRALSWLRNDRPNFEQRRFIDYLKNEMPVDRGAYMIDGAICMDHFIRYESLETDIERTCRRIGVEYNAGFLPTFKAGIRSNRATVEALYTDESRELVERKFAFELQYFGYDYPGGSRSTEA